MLKQNNLVSKKAKSLKRIVESGIITKKQALELFYDYLKRNGFCDKKLYCKFEEIKANFRNKY